MSKNKPNRINSRFKETKQVKTQQNTYNQEEILKQKLIQYSETEFNRKESMEKFSALFDNKIQTGAEKKGNKTERNRNNQIALLNKTSISAQFNYLQRRGGKDRKNETQIFKQREQILSHGKNLRESVLVLVRQPVSVSNYFIAGSPNHRKQYLSVPKSDYVIRQRRNTKKLRRIQEKRESQQIKQKNSLIDKIITQREAQKILTMRAMLLGNKYKLKHEGLIVEPMPIAEVKYK